VKKVPHLIIRCTFTTAVTPVTIFCQDIKAIDDELQESSAMISMIVLSSMVFSLDSVSYSTSRCP
jgi:hypothetical protein